MVLIGADKTTNVVNYIGAWIRLETTYSNEILLNLSVFVGEIRG